MGYLKCDKCGGYYELQKGESQADFDLKCECGGNIEYKESIKFNDSPKKDDYNIKKIFLTILVVVIILAIFTLFLKELLPLIVAATGFIVSFQTVNSYKNGIINGAIIGALGGALAFLSYIFGYFITEGAVFCAHCLAIYAALYIPFFMILGILGSILAVFIKKRIKG